MKSLLVALSAPAFVLGTLSWGVVALGSEEVPTESGELRFAASSAEVVFGGFAPHKLHEIREYGSDPERGFGSAVEVPIRRWPADLSEKARYGLKVVHESLLAFVVDEDGSGRYRIKLDLTADGDLDNDPWKEMEQCTGRDVFDPNVTLTPFARNFIDPDAATTLFDTTFERVHVLFGITILPNRNTFLELHETQRQGTVLIGSKPVKFALVGSDGWYYDQACFDFDGDGTLIPLLGMAERFRNSDIVNLEGHDLELAIDEQGNYLVLRPPSEAATRRPRLSVGTVAPGFAFSDIDGKVGALEEYRGKALLLYFWGTWCGPCRAATRELLNTYSKLHGSGFEVLGIDTYDDANAIRQYAKEQAIPWRQIEQGNDGAIVQLYRVKSYPHLILIDEQGVIDGKWTIITKDTDGLEARVVALLRKLAADSH
jgi:peroxiredoxin